MKTIIDHGDVIEIISGGPDEWAASNSIIAEAKARWEAEAAAKNGEVEVAQTDDAQSQTITKSGSPDNNRILGAIATHDKSLA